LRRELPVVLRLHDQVWLDGQHVVSQAVQCAEEREIGLGVQVGELDVRTVARFVGGLSGERKVANPSRGNPCLKFPVHDVEQVGRLA